MLLTTELLANAITLCRQKKRLEARQILIKVISKEPRNQIAWLWLADTVDTIPERVQVLQRALQVQPGMDKVQEALTTLISFLIKSNALEPLNILQQVKDSASGHPASVILAPIQPEQAKPMPAIPVPLYSKSQDVYLLPSPQLRGKVNSDPSYAENEWQYEIYFSAYDLQHYREADLAPVVVKVTWEKSEDLLRDLAMLKLRKPLGDSLYALYGSRTQFEVYQFRPVVKFLGNPDQRLLIADEVGLGKTIEAGIIYLELQARLDLERVLVVCPSGLRYKWQDEMKSRFDEDFIILDVAGLRQFIQQYQQYGEQYRLRGIVSLESIRREEFAEAIANNQINFDLVIIDEAHHCRNTNTLSNNIASILSENADAMLLLTATPLQIGNEDLFHLLNILAPGEFDDFNVFTDRIEPNQYVNRAAQILATGEYDEALKELRKVEAVSERKRFLDNPYYKQLVEMLKKGTLSRAELVTIQRRLTELNTLGYIFTRTRKREISSQVAQRAAFTLAVSFTPEEQAFYDHVVQQVREEFLRANPNSMTTAWVSIMRERQAASCISAARRRYASIQDGNVDFYSEDEQIDETITGEMEIEPEALQAQVISSLEKFSAKIKVVHPSRKIPTDSKFEIFFATLKAIMAEDQESKVLVFSFFRETVEYLYGRLNQSGYGVRYVHGGIKVPERQATIDHFREDPQIRILISSDVGAEGLDFQFCNTIFNYDLPWNPMKVEQRIGRIDRFGQQSKRIRIYSMMIDNSVESRILMRLYERIGIFERSIGDIEAILGEEIREISRRIYTARLSPKEEVDLATLMAENVIRRQQEMEDFEQKRLQFMGQEAIFSAAINETIETGRFVSDREVHALVASFICQNFPDSCLEHNNDNGQTYTLDPNNDLVASIRSFIYQQRSSDSVAKDFLKRLRPGKLMPLTFSSDLAYQRKPLDFVTLRHPLTLAAVDFWKKAPVIDSRMAIVAVRAASDLIGHYYFFIFAIDSQGIEKSSRLLPVVVNANNSKYHAGVSQQLLRLLQNSTDLLSSENEYNPAQFASAKASAMQKIVSERNVLQENIQNSNTALVNARLAAVEQSYKAKRAKVKSSLDSATDARIQRMRESQLMNIDAKHSLAIQKIKAQQEVSVSYSLELSGFLEITTFS